MRNSNHTYFSNTSKLFISIIISLTLVGAWLRVEGINQLLDAFLHQLYFLDTRVLSAKIDSKPPYINY